jgi:hypothetical protein
MNTVRGAWRVDKRIDGQKRTGASGNALLSQAAGQEGGSVDRASALARAERPKQRPIMGRKPQFAH